VLLALDGRADLIVVDAPPELVQEAQLLTFSERVLVVTSPELASVKDTKVVIGALAEGDPERLAIVLNHPTDRRSRTTDDDVAHAIGIPVVADLPFDDHLADVDHPATVPPARSGFGREIHDLAGRALPSR
jgi:Flp pilus assembly CpaE family ATPase